MIFSVKMTAEDEHYFNYLHELTRNKQVAKLVRRLEKGIEFKSGINVLVGENGCGKSTLLNIIKRGNLLEHSFIPKSNYLQVTDLEQVDKLYDCFEIKQDLRLPVFNLYRMTDDSSKIASNEICSKLEMAQFLGMKEESYGQNLKADLSMLFHIMFDMSSECYPMMYYLKNDAENFPTPEANDESTIKVTSPDGPAIMRKVLENQVDCVNNEYTILMDEPDKGLDIHNIEDIYETVSYQKENTQLIVSLHNIFLIQALRKLNYINFIELSDGYLKKIDEFCKKHNLSCGGNKK